MKSAADSNMEAIAKAIAALEKGVGARFRQTRAAQDLWKCIMNKADMADDDKQVLVSFLSSSNAETSPGTDTTIRMLKQMEATMKSVLLDGAKEEEATIYTYDNTYDELMGSKGQEVEALTEWEERSKTRAEELRALSGTIKSLNDDNAWDLFKKHSPVAVQVLCNSCRRQEGCSETGLWVWSD